MLQLRIIATFPHETDPLQEVDVDIDPTIENLEVANDYNPNGNLPDYLDHLDNSSISYSVYERPKRKPRN